MSGFEAFMREKKVKRENFKVVASRSFLDEDGKPIEFEFKPLTTRDNDAIRDDCFKTQTIKGKSKSVFDRSKYQALVLARTCVFPNLNNAELQDSYGVKTPEDLIVEMIDDPAEYAALFAEVAEKNGFGLTNNDVDTVKNS